MHTFFSNKPKLSKSAIASILEPEARELWEHLVAIIAVMLSTCAMGVNKHVHTIYRISSKYSAQKN